MANPEHLAILKQGVEAWNRWREENPYTLPNLFSAYMRERDLQGIHLQHVDLRRADFTGTNLTGADLTEANLRGTVFSKANLAEANLLGANMVGTRLDDAKLSRTNLGRAKLDVAHLEKAEFAHSYWGHTIVSDCDLSTALGLDNVYHLAPSTIGIDTILRSGGRIPETFLRGAGMPENLITYLPSLIGKAFDYYTAFLSYSDKDKDFTERLHNDLQAKGVRVWYAPEDLKIGDKFRMEIDQAIRLYDKLMVVLSDNSIASDWVESEVEAAFEKEREQGKTVLFPLRLDDAVMETNEAWAAEIRRTRHIGNFTNWNDHDAYQAALKKLLEDLQGEKPV